MRRTIATAMLALATAACSSTPAPAPAPQAATTTVAATTGQPAAATTAAAKAKIGVPVSIKAAGGTTIEVTIVKVVDPAKPSNENLTLPVGEHWVGVQFKFANKGPGTFADNFYGLSAADGQGQKIRIQADAEIAAGPSIEVLQGVRLSPGDTSLGFITFFMTAGVKVARVQYTPAGGGTGEWNLG